MLELTLQTKLALNSETHPPLPPVVLGFKCLIQPPSVAPYKHVMWARLCPSELHGNLHTTNSSLFANWQTLLLNRHAIGSQLIWALLYQQLRSLVHQDEGKDNIIPVWMGGGRVSECVCVCPGAAGIQTCPCLRGRIWTCSFYYVRKAGRIVKAEENIILYPDKLYINTKTNSKVRTKA